MFEQIERIHEIGQIHRQSTATPQWELPGAASRETVNGFFVRSVKSFFMKIENQRQDGFQDLKSRQQKVEKNVFNLSAKRLRTLN